MRVFLATVVGITAANAGFGAGLLGSILLGPWMGRALPAITMGYAVGGTAMLLSFGLAMRSPVASRR
jgi:hypothetical protein